LQVVVTTVNQMGDILMYRKHPREPWAIATAAIPTKEECAGEYTLRQAQAYFHEGDGCEYVVASVLKSLAGDLWLTMRPASSRESATGPVLVKPVMLYSETWSPRLNAWTDGRFSDCVRMAARDTAGKVPIGDVVSKRPREMDRRKPADLSRVSAESLRDSMLAVRK